MANSISLRERIRANLVQAMEKAGINQVQLADRLDISKGTVNNWTRGNNSPDVDMVPKICDVLGISITSLYSPTIAERANYPDTKNAPSVSDEAMRLARDYDTALDDRGRKMVRGLADLEIGYAAKRAEKEKAERKAEMIKHREETADEIAVYVTTLYHQPVSAGNGENAAYDYSETVQLKKMPPNGTSYIVPVQGDSMEPLFSDGDKVFVRAQIEIEPGQAGVFYMDGQMWIKELGDGALLSHNPKYPPRPMTDDVRCQGLVLGVCDDSYFVK